MQSSRRNKQRERRRNKWRKHRKHGGEEEEHDKSEGGSSAPFSFEQPGNDFIRTFFTKSKVAALKEGCYTNAKSSINKSRSPHADMGEFSVVNGDPVPLITTPSPPTSTSSTPTPTPAARKQVCSNVELQNLTSRRTRGHFTREKFS